MRPSIDSLCADAQFVVMEAERAARRDESRRVRQVDTCMGSQPLGTLKPLHGRNDTKELWVVCYTDRQRCDLPVTGRGSVQHSCLPELCSHVSSVSLGQKNMTYSEPRSTLCGEDDKLQRFWDEWKVD